MHILVNILISTIVAFVAAQIAPGVALAGWGTALAVAIILGVLNALIFPVLLVLTIPLNILTLGLFTFVIMGFLVWLTSALVPGFYVSNFLTCIVFGLIFAVLNFILKSAF